MVSFDDGVSDRRRPQLAAVCVASAEYTTGGAKGEMEPSATALPRAAGTPAGCWRRAGGRHARFDDPAQGSSDSIDRIMLPLSATSNSGRYGLARPRRERPAGYQTTLTETFQAAGENDVTSPPRSRSIT